MSELTFNEHGKAMLERIDELAVEHGYTRATSLVSDHPARDLALARMHLEDSLTRFNSACYRIVGTWARQDPEKVIARA